MVELHHDMLEKVRKLAELLRTQDNRITANPIFMVQKQVREWGVAEGYEEGATWCNDEGPETDSKVLKVLRGRGVEFGTERELNGRTYRRIAYRDRWENVQPFLTEAGANEYLRINGHNLGKTRIYVESGYRNAEWEFMRELILALGKPGPRRTSVDVPASEGLDPIHLLLTDYGPGHGELTATCFGRSWTAYWGGMGNKDVASFVASVGKDYLAEKLCGRNDSYSLRISQAIISHLRTTMEVSRG